MYDASTVYIVVSHSGTLPANLVRLATHKPFSHVCYAPDADLNALYSFGRIYPEFFVPGGFIDGGIRSAFYRGKPNTRLRVYAVSLTPAQKELVEMRLAPFLAQPRHYHYGFLNCVLQHANIPLRRARHYTCSQFVAMLFEGVLPFHKDISLVQPMDFCALSLPCVYEGTAGAFSTGCAAFVS